MMINPGDFKNISSDYVDEFEIMAELALDLHWSWNHASDFIWKYLDNEQWQITQNPWSLLQTVSRERIKSAFADPIFRQQLAHLIEIRQQFKSQTSWFERTYPNPSVTCIAYFSMEFMLSEALPIYSGGLGNVAGDHLKAASDLGVPIIGVGLLYQQGYFRQLINNNGEQHASFPYNDPWQLPITPLRNVEGDWLRVQIDLPGHTIWLRAWQVRVGARKLYLLDSNDPANFPPYRGITSELYKGDSDIRLMQEIILGIGGWRLLTALKIKPEVCHLNEGHAAFAALERAHALMKQTGLSFDIALTISRAGNLFTTHTAVEAGFDRFSPQQVERFLGKYAREQLHISLDKLLALGRKNCEDKHEFFNMAFLAIRTSGFVNGVSCLHAEVSRKLFAPLFPRWPIDEVPIGYVTNGVHMPTWDSAAADTLWTNNCKKTRWLGSTDNIENEIRKIPDSELWQFRNESRDTFLTFLQKRLVDQMAIDGRCRSVADLGSHCFDSNVLTIGFARRFAAYKRPNLLLHNPERLISLLTHVERPMRLVIAGKAHPKDVVGQALIQQWHDFIRNPQVNNHVFFLNDYDMLLATHLVQGVDVWLNTPQRPWEACGTSGMKVLVNGGLNLSELDGWWAEAFSPELGWALGDGREHDDPHWNDIEAEMLYELLEHEVIPEFYRRNAEHIPTAWVARVRESMAQLTPRYSTNRSLREYVDNYYLPATKIYLKRLSSGGEAAMEIVSNQKLLEKKWGSVHFGKFHAEQTKDMMFFEVEIYLNDLDVNNVDVQLYASSTLVDAAEKHQMHQVRDSTSADGFKVFRVCMRSLRPVNDYTPRAIWNGGDFLTATECGYILWQR